MAIRIMLSAMMVALSAAGGFWWGHNHFAAQSSAYVVSTISTTLDALKKECDLDSPTANYEWSLYPPQTENIRRALLERLVFSKSTGDHALREAGRRLRNTKNEEFRQMLSVVAASLGDADAVAESCFLMIYSGFPAVRVSAAEVLGKLRDTRTIEWFKMALDDPLHWFDGDSDVVPRQFKYPVRMIAVIALRDMGVAESEFDANKMQTSP